MKHVIESTSNYTEKSFTKQSLRGRYGSKYSRMNKVKFVEDSL